MAPNLLNSHILSVKLFPSAVSEFFIQRSLPDLTVHACEHEKEPAMCVVGALCLELQMQLS